MPWKECNIVEERLRFIARLLDGEKMSGLCRKAEICWASVSKIDYYENDPLQNIQKVKISTN